MGIDPNPEEENPLLAPLGISSPPSLTLRTKDHLTSWPWSKFSGETKKAIGGDVQWGGTQKWFGFHFSSPIRNLAVIPKSQLEESTRGGMEIHILRPPKAQSSTTKNAAVKWKSLEIKQNFVKQQKIIAFSHKKNYATWRVSFGFLFNLFGKEIL